MGGNSPSHLTHEEGEGGVTLVKGIRLSDKVIHRMRQPSPVIRPQSSQQKGPSPHSSETQAPSPLSTPSAENMTHPPAVPLEAPSTPPSAEPAPPSIKLVPPPVKFHSLPPTSVEPIATLPPPPPPSPPPAETKTDPVFPATPPPPPSIAPEVKENLEPDSPPPTPSLEPVDLPPPEPFIPLLIEPASPPAHEKVIESLVLPSPVESSTAAAAPSEPSAPSPLSEPVKPAPPPTELPVAAPVVDLLESIVPSSPPVEMVQTPLSLEITPPEPAVPPCPVDSAPAESVFVHPQVEPLVSAEEVAPEPVAAPSPASELPFEEPRPPCHCVELAVVPADAPVSEHLIDSPTPPPSETATAPEESTPIPSPPRVVEDEVPAVASVPPFTQASSISPEVVEEELRQKIKEEMQRSLEEEVNKRRQELQQQLEEMRAQARAEARAAAQAQVEEQVKKTLETEKVATMENLTDSLVKERMKTEDKWLMAQLYWMELKAHQLEERENELKKRNILYKEHVAKLEAKCAEFYKVTAESFQRGNEETRNRFSRFNVQPVCGDLQSQILKCYRDNAGKTLSCSSIASAYMQCVDSAKKNKLSTGG